MTSSAGPPSRTPSASARSTLPARPCSSEVGAADVGEHLGHAAEDERVVTHYFACTPRRLPRLALGGHRGPRLPRRRRSPSTRSCCCPATTRSSRPRGCPGGADPARRPRPRRPAAHRGGRPAAGARLPQRRPGDEVVDQDSRPRRSSTSSGSAGPAVLSLEGRDLAAQRWYDGSHGPDAPIAQSAPASCGSCGFLVRLAGPLSQLFGVCANAYANDDGRVVSFDHGCGAHSEAQLAKKNQPPPLPEPVLDTLTVGRAREVLDGRGPRLGPRSRAWRRRCGGAGSSPSRSRRGRTRPGRSRATRAVPVLREAPENGSSSTNATSQSAVPTATVRHAVDVERLDVGDDVGAGRRSRAVVGTLGPPDCSGHRGCPVLLAMVRHESPSSRPAATARRAPWRDIRVAPLRP